MKSLLLLFLIFTSSVFARGFYTPFFVGGVAATAIVGTHTAVYRSLIQNELQNWSRPETGTTVRLENQCGVEAEFHLAGNNRDNYLLLGIANTTPNGIGVKTKNIKFIYDNKRDRFPGFRHDMSDSNIAAGWWQVQWIPFPSKDEFKKVDQIKVEVPIWNESTKENCVITTSFERTKHVDIEDRSFSAVEFLIDGGAPLGQFGDIEELGKPNGIVSFEFNFYLRPNHALGFVYSNENDFDGSKNPKITSEFDEGKNYSAAINFFGIQYVYRHFLTQNVYLTYGPSLGVQFIDDMKENDRNNRESSTDMVFSEKFMLNWRFYQFQAANYEMMDFFTGIGIIHYWAPTPEVNGQDLGGNRLNAVVRLGFGF